MIKYRIFEGYFLKFSFIFLKVFEIVKNADIIKRYRIENSLVIYFYDEFRIRLIESLI